MRNSVLGAIAVVIIAVAAFLFFKAPTKAPTQPASPNTAATNASPTTPAEGKSGMVGVDDQLAGATVSVKLVSFQKPGFATIHEENKGQPGPVIGVSVLLPVGASTNVVVPVSPSTVSGKVYFAMLHSDDSDGTYQFPGPDGPLQAADGTVVMMKFTATSAVAQGDAAGTAAAKVDVGALTFSMESGNFFYKPSTFKAKVNQPVTINFTNSGFHTFTIDELGVNQTITGSTGSVTFTPTKKGTFEFYCAIGNHKAMGMKGTLTVE